MRTAQRRARGSVAHPLPPARRCGSMLAGGGHEAVEDGEGVERAGRALGVVLDGLDRQVPVAQALDRAVVEVHLADAEAARPRGASRRRP